MLSSHAQEWLQPTESRKWYWKRCLSSILLCNMWVAITGSTTITICGMEGQSNCKRQKGRARLLSSS